MTNLLTSVTSTPDPEMSSPGVTCTRISISGDPTAAAVVDAVIDAYDRIDDPTAALEAVGVKGQVTLVRAGSNMLGAPVLSSEVGRLFKPSSGGWAYLPKGRTKNGYGITPSKLLDVIPGWNEAEAARRVAAARATLPELEPLTQAHLEALPAAGERDDQPCSLAVFGTWRMPDGNAPGSVWLIQSYDPEDDICDGVLLIRPGYGTSEHGSVYGAQLLRGHFGVVSGFVPVSFAAAIGMEDVDHDVMLATIGGAK